MVDDGETDIGSRTNEQNHSASKDQPRSSWSRQNAGHDNFNRERPLSSEDRERAENQRQSKVRADQKQSDDDKKADQLARAIEAEIIPRLLLSHIAARTIKSVIQSPPPVGEGAFPASKVAVFSDLVRHKPLNEAIVFIDALLQGGMAIETMILDVLSPSARHLGQQWERDEITFVDVTLGLSRLQQLLRVYGPAFEVDFAPDHKGHRILLAAMPGEQHTFGMAVVEEFFRRDGWDVHSESNVTQNLLLGRVRDEWFDVVGLSASGDASVALLSPLIRAIRDAALNRHIRVIVGGCQFLAEPANALALGADMVACNGREAVLNIDRLMSPHAKP